MIETPNKKRMRAESEIELFLRLFPLLAAHFELKDSVTPSSLATLLGGNAASELARQYEDALDNELQSDPTFVDRLPSVLRSPKVKQPIIDDE